MLPTNIYLLNWIRLWWLGLWTILLIRLDDHGLMLTKFLNVLPSSVGSIFRSGPSSTFQHFGRGEGERSRAPKSSMLSSLVSFYLLAAGLLLLPLLSAWRADFPIAVKGGSWTPNSLMSSSKSVFFLLAAGPPLLFLLMLLEISSL